MDFAFDEEQEELRATARAFLVDHSGSEQIRAAMESELGHDPQLWKQVATELGWTAITVPEAYGGLGLGPIELTALIEVMGESLVCVPFFSTVCLGANALVVAGTEEQKQAHLPRIAEGESIASLAHAGPSESVEVVFRQAKDGVLLEGRADFVVDGSIADLLIAAARDAETNEIALFVVPSDTPGLSRSLHPTLDQTRRLASLRFDDVKLPLDARLAGGESALQEILDRAVIALAAEQVGGAQRCLDMAVAYAKEREQFGRPIGSFQAIKHKCADMMIELESARSAAYYAACIAAEGNEELPVVASLAKAYCSDAYFQCAAESLQVHGGVGFTWEYDVQLYFKRARSSEVLLGNPDFHRERVAGLIGL